MWCRTDSTGFPGVVRAAEITTQDQNAQVEIIGAKVSKLHEILLVEGKLSFDQKSSPCHKVHLDFGEFLH